MSVLGQRGARGLLSNAMQPRCVAPLAGPRVSVASRHREAGVGTSAHFARRHVGDDVLRPGSACQLAGAKPARREPGGCLTVYCTAELAASAVYAF